MQNDYLLYNIESKKKGDFLSVRKKINTFAANKKTNTLRNEYEENNYSLIRDCDGLFVGPCRIEGERP